MALWLDARICCIACCAIVSYAFPRTDGKDGATYLKEIGHLEKSADQQTLPIGDHEEVSTAMKDFPEFASLSETGELDNETMAMMNVQRCGVENKTGNCVRNKRSVGEDVPNLCADAKLDTVTRIENGRTYAFKGKTYGPVGGCTNYHLSELTVEIPGIVKTRLAYKNTSGLQSPMLRQTTRRSDFSGQVIGEHFWKVRDHGIPEGYPKSISAEWDGLPGNLDASFTFSNGKTYFFKGSQYWRFVNKKMDKGYPKPISQRFPGIPDNVDAAFVWRGDGKIYFFKGTEYWRFDFSSDPSVDSRYPQSISEKWSSLLADGIDAAFHWQDRHIYFFKDDQYYRYNGETSEVDEAHPPYPHSTATGWLGCR